jgi:hypothetical protein
MIRGNVRLQALVGRRRAAPAPVERSKRITQMQGITMRQPCESRFQRCNEKANQPLLKPVIICYLPTINSRQQRQNGRKTNVGADIRINALQSIDCEHAFAAAKGLFRRGSSREG